MPKMEEIETRIDIFIRIMGFIYLGLGGALAYYTTTTPLLPQLSPIMYFFAVLFIIAGIGTIIAKLKS